jgi:hypothetical protein
MVLDSFVACCGTLLSVVLVLGASSKKHDRKHWFAAHIMWLDIANCPI